MPHFKTYCTKRVIDENSDYPLGVWKSVREYESSHPEKLRAVESKIVKTHVNGKDVDVLTNVWLFAGDFGEFKDFVHQFYIEAGIENLFTPGKNSYAISESAVALVPMNADMDCALSRPHPLPKIRSQLSARNWLTFCEDDFPDVDINLSNNSFTLPLTEAIKLAEQIMRIAKHHGELVSLHQKPNKSSPSSDVVFAESTA